MNFHPLTFMRSVFSEPDGTGSASRVMMAVHAVAGIAFVCHHLYHGHALGEVPWVGVTTFVATPYAINKGSQALSSVLAIAPKS